MHSFVIQKLGRYKSRIEELISDAVVFLITGSAVDVFCNTIENVTLDSKLDGIGIIPFDVKINWFDRYNGKVLAEFDDMIITGFRSQFSMLYGEHNGNCFVKLKRGIGININSDLEGYRVHNFFATQILGPILPLNPLFCEHLISLTGKVAQAAFKDEAMSAYSQRVKEFSDPKIKFE